MRNRLLPSVLLCFTALLSACPDGVEAVSTPEGMVTIIKSKPPQETPRAPEKNPLPRR